MKRRHKNQPNQMRSTPISPDGKKKNFCTQMLKDPEGGIIINLG